LDFAWWTGSVTEPKGDLSPRSEPEISRLKKRDLLASLGPRQFFVSQVDEAVGARAAALAEN
jgi:hypothetical protein